jgi:hypothetical protein
MERFLAGEWGTGLLLEYVCLEVVTVVMLRLELAAAVRFGRILLEAEELEFAHPAQILSSKRWMAFPGKTGPASALWMPPLHRPRAIGQTVKF